MKETGILARFMKPIDMTEGTPWKKIGAFAVPMLIGNIAQQLYSTVDSIVVGRYVGDNALAAVGNAFPIYFLLLVLFMGVSTGATILVSQYIGAKDREGLSKSIGASILLAIVVSVLMMIVGPLISRPLLKMIATPDSIIDWCEDYLVILFLGLLGMAFYNMLTGILRGLGDSLSALFYLLIATVINIVLDIAFVKYFKMEVAGVALATIIAQFISAGLCLIKVARMKQYFDLKLKYVRFSRKYSLDIVRLGLPSGLTQAIFSLAMVVVQRLTNSFGEMVIAANVIVMRIDGFAMMPNMSFANAMTTYAGQNLGARKIDRIEKGTRQGLLLTGAVATFLVICIVLFGRHLMAIFTETEELITMSNRFMRILAVGYIAVGFTQVYQGVMRGAGDTMTPMWLSLITTVAIRVPLAYLMAFLTRSAEYPDGRFEILPISLLVSWIIGVAASVIFYKKGKWKKQVDRLRTNDGTEEE
ncbi:MAG: MATE family efflux transporter [Lachnospiraceae bacterium]|nr:MATE family efflux transporter [Lachnospiraceae bacterium]